LISIVVEDRKPTVPLVQQAHIRAPQPVPQEVSKVPLAAIASGFSAVAAGSYASVALTLSVPLVAAVAALAFIVTKLIIFLLQQIFKSSQPQPQQQPLEMLPFIEATKPPQREKAALPAMVKIYMDWFREAAPKPADKVDIYNSNMDQIADRAIEYGNTIKSWAEEWGLSLSDDHDVLSALQTDFLDYVSKNCPDLTIPLESFGIVVEATTRPFFSPEQKDKVRRLLEPYIQFKPQPLRQEELQQNYVATLQLAGKDNQVEELSPEMMLALVRNHNRLQVAKLTSDLEKIVKDHPQFKSIPQEVVARGCLVPPSVWEGRVLYSQEIETLIENKLHALIAAKGQLSQLRNILNQDKYTAVEEIVHAKLPTLKVLREADPIAAKELIDEYRILMNRAVLNTQISNKNQFYDGRENEIEVLKALDIDVTRYDDDLSRQAASMLFMQLSHLQSPSKLKNFEVAKFREQIKYMAFQERMRLLKVPEEQHAHLYTLVKAVGTIEAKLTETYHKKMDQIVEVPLSDAFKAKLPRTAARFSKEKEDYFKQMVKVYAQLFFREFKEHLLPALKNNDMTFNVMLDRYMETYISGDTCGNAFNHRRVERFLEQKINFYNLFLDASDIVEYEQGEEGEDSILGDGICWGKALDVDYQLLKDPEKKLSELSVPTANSHHRFLQATHIVNHMVGKYEVHHGVKKRLGIKQERHAPVVGIENFILSLRTQYEALQASNPSFMIYIMKPGVYGHAVEIRFDVKLNRYIFFDANHGAFESKHGTPWLEEILRQVANHDWPDATHFAVEHLTNENAT